ncbi:MAG: 50S ribosomal protein L17 [Nitrospiria bacterium]
MRHRKSGRQLGRNSSHRRSLFRNLVTSFLRHERIETTEAKAKEMSAIVERMISLGKKGDLHARRKALSYVYDPSVVAYLFSNIAPRFADTNGGYVRLLKTRIRQGDAAQMAILELTKTEDVPAASDEKDPKKG